MSTFLFSEKHEVIWWLAFSYYEELVTCLYIIMTADQCWVLHVSIESITGACQFICLFLNCFFFCTFSPTAKHFELPLCLVLYK